ncbi:MAG TPA: hypothetical protein VJL59_04905 [Anaerolineales bacterium]|nr:hypothetical protein [Anaerolineales bacterium]
MNSQPFSTPIERYLAVDLPSGKHYVVVGGVNAQQQVVLPPRRISSVEEVLALKPELREELGLPES